MKNVYVNDFTRSVKAYYEELRQFKVLSREEERALIIKAKNNNTAARQELVQCNLRFVFEIAKRYTGHGVAIEDLIAEGNLGLFKAIEKFDLAQEIRFATYAIHWIKFYIKDLIKNHYATRVLEVSEEVLNSNIKANHLDDEDDVVLMRDCLPMEDSQVTINETKNELMMLTNLLKPREKQIVRSYYGLVGDRPKTLEEIGDELELSKERIRQLRDESLEFLKVAANKF